MKTGLSLPAVLLLVFTACGGGNTSGPVSVRARLLAINGASEPFVERGSVAVFEGEGFGTTAENNLVVFTTAVGTVAAEITDWSDIRVSAVVPDETVSGPSALIKGQDTLGIVGVVVRERGNFDPAALAWQAGPDLPLALIGHAAAALNYPNGGDVRSLILVTGGIGADTVTAATSFLGTVDAQGQVTAWTTGEQLLPEPRRLHATAGATRATARLGFAQGTLVEGVAYVIGGLGASGAPLGTLFGVGIDSEGRQGLWTSLTPVPQALAGSGAAVARGNLFVVGGFGRDSIARRDVFFTALDTLGLISGWFEGPPLPMGLAFASLTVQDNVLYLSGGEAGVIDPNGNDTMTVRSDRVYAMRLSTKTGVPADSEWIDVGAMTQARSRHASFALDTGLLITGGRTADSVTAAESEFAPFAQDGTLGVFSPLQAPEISPMADTTAGLVNQPASNVVLDAKGTPHPVLVGGRVGNAGTPLAKSWWH